MVATNGQVPSRDKLEEKLTGDPLTQGYRPTLPNWALETSGTSWLPQIYLLRDIELMLTHPKVASVLEYFKGGIAGVEFDIECKQPEVQVFLEKQIARWWDRGVPLIQGGYDYGWIGCEPVYTTEDGPLAWDYLEQFSPRDTFVLTQNNKIVGIRVKNVIGKQAVDLWASSDGVPCKGIWYPHNPRFNKLYGRSQLMSAWRPWRRLAWKDAAESVTDTGVYRFAFSGPLIKYPEEDLQVAQQGVPATQLDSQGRPRRPARDVARQMAEWAKAGAGIGLPSSMYPPELGGGPKWIVEWPSHVMSVDPLINYCLYLEKQISYGIGVPPELLEAAETGSGYSGRDIPMQGFLMTQQKIADAILELFVRQILKPLVIWNWGPQVRFEVKVKPLLQTKREHQMGQSGAGAAQGNVTGRRQQKGSAVKTLGGQRQPTPPSNFSTPRPPAHQPAVQGKFSVGDEALVRARALSKKILERAA